MELFFDTETSGLPRRDLPAGHPEQVWVVQLAAVLSEEVRVYASFNLVLRADGRSISPEAAAVHGYTTGLCDRVGANEAVALEMLFALVSSADVLIAHNRHFDMEHIENIAVRQQMVRPGGLGKPGICTMYAGTELCKLPGRYGRWKWPKLEELHQHLFGEDIEGAHDALVDVMAVRRCYYEMRRRGVFGLGGRG